MLSLVAGCTEPTEAGYWDQILTLSLPSYSEGLILLQDNVPKIAMMDSRETERMSRLLSKYMEREFTGTKEVVEAIRRAICLREHFEPGIVICGSRGEGIYVMGSDIDVMYHESSVSVLNSNQSISHNMASKTIFYIREADCRPGYVHLELKQFGQDHSNELCESLVKVGNSMFLSSDIYREKFVIKISEFICQNVESNGPSCTAFAPPNKSADFVSCFHCNSWPKEANEWRSRARLYGWPSQTLIDDIVDSGCYLVPVGDKCSAVTLLQWRISFATAERSLVHSFTHIQLKVYTLLKYFLKQIKDTLADTIGDDDILCSYFLKTLMFHAIENTSQKLWHEKNVFYCFCFCVHILIAWVRAWILSKLLHPSQQLIQKENPRAASADSLDVLINYCEMKWLCLSVGNRFKPIWSYLGNIANQAELSCPQTVQDIVLGQDIGIVQSLIENDCLANPLSLRKAITVLSTSHSDYDQVIAYHHITGYLFRNAANQAYVDQTFAPDNKTRYMLIRKCKRWMGHRASMGTEVLYLATLYFLLGLTGKALSLSKQVTKLASCYELLISSYEQKQALEQTGVMGAYWFHQSGHMLDRLRTIYVSPLQFVYLIFYLPHLCLENKVDILFPPLPYAVFLTFLCCHDIGDATGRDAALRHLVEVQGDHNQGGHRFWIVHNLLGICYQMLGDNHRALRAFWDSARSNNFPHERNPAIKRIALVYLCMYASTRSAQV